MGSMDSVSELQGTQQSGAQFPLIPLIEAIIVPIIMITLSMSVIYTVGIINGIDIGKTK